MKPNPHKQRIVLIFGVSGFVGGSFWRYLKKNFPEEGLKIIGVASSNGRKAPHDMYHLEIVDNLDIASIKLLLVKHKPDYIANFIGLFGNAGYQELISANVEIPHNILQAIVDVDALKTRVLLIGSAAEYGAINENPVSETSPLAPVNRYGLSKVFQTQLASFYYRSHQVQVVIARTFNLTGFGIATTLSVGSFQAQIDASKDGDVIQVGNLDSVRDFLDIESAVKAYMTILLDGDSGEIYNVCSGKPTRIGDLLGGMIARSGKKLSLKVSRQKIHGNDVVAIYGDGGKLDSLLSRSSGG